MNIAINKGIERNSIIRIKAAIIYIINEVCNTYGHSYIYKEELIEYYSTIDHELYSAINEELMKQIIDMFDSQI